MKKNFGFDLLIEQSLDRVAAQMSEVVLNFSRPQAFAQSPIEALFEGALYFHLRYVSQEWFSEYWVAKDDDALEKLKVREDYRNILIIQRQVQLENWRVDFMVHAYADWAREPNGGLEGWRKLIVECDGHDFHERTKEQAAKDRSRDRRAQSIGLEVFRFTGSELWRDPLGCAEQVVQWANRGV